MSKQILMVSTLVGLLAIPAVHEAMVGAERQNATFGPWSSAGSLESTPPFAHPSLNTTFQDGCPAPSADGRYLLLATNRGGPSAGLDIWISQRGSANDPWGAPVALPPPVNTPANEFCPTPAPDGRTLLFVSTRPGGCGGGDIYYTTWLGGNDFTEPVNLGCGVNSAGEEASPFLVADASGRWHLYFSSTRAGGVLQEAQGAVTGDSDIYMIEGGPNGFTSALSLVPAINTVFDDTRPNLSSDGREIFFDSNRPGSQGIDIWTSQRESIAHAFSEPVNVASVNSPANETRAYLGSDGTTLYLGSTRSDSEGSGDLYVARRVRLGGQ
jgi:hypothetical protein